MDSLNPPAAEAHKEKKKRRKHRKEEGDDAKSSHPSTLSVLGGLRSSALGLRSSSLLSSNTANTLLTNTASLRSSLLTSQVTATGTTRTTSSTTTTSSSLRNPLLTNSHLTNNALTSSSLTTNPSLQSSLLSQSGSNTTKSTMTSSLLSTKSTGSHGANESSSPTKTSSSLSNPLLAAKPSALLATSTSSALASKLSSLSKTTTATTSGLTSSLQASKLLSTVSSVHGGTTTSLRSLTSTMSMTSSLLTSRGASLGGKTAGQMTGGDDSEAIDDQVYLDTEPMPEYHFDKMEVDEAEVMNRFVTLPLPTAPDTTMDSEVLLEKLKSSFINAMAASLIGSPDFYNPRDRTRVFLTSIAALISPLDGEFVLKLALFTRMHLNIRTPANFLLALASSYPESRKHLRKYFTASINLPSDWIEVAQLYQSLHDQSLHEGSLPTALRKAMIQKFRDFDDYQLGKYNKESKPKPKPEPGKIKREVSNKSDDEEEVEKMTFTLKQLIRKLHISEPVNSVMCLLGKKYPANLDEFYQSHLPGTFDPDRANKRMKLPVPETWETQVSMHGNKASVWEKLIDNGKLPFMAMLRNLRNLIKANVGPKYHNMIIGRLTNEKAVVSSRQFPFRFFSAYEVLAELLNPKPPKGKGKDKAKKQTEEVPPPKDLIDRYRNALDTSVKIATTYNVKPISGTTIVLCNASPSMMVPCSSAKGLGKPRQVLDIAVLLGLMCKYVCEESSFILFSDDFSHEEVKVIDGTILHNMETVLKQVSTLAGRGCVRCGCKQSESWGTACEHPECATGCEFKTPNVDNVGFPIEYLRSLVRDRVQIDNLVILSNDDISPPGVDDFLVKYRRLVNDNLLFVNIDLSASKPDVCDAMTDSTVHPNDVRIAGYSDQILRFIAERGDGNGLLTFVENIDRLYDLDAALQAAEGKESLFAFKPTSEAQSALVTGSSLSAQDKKQAKPQPAPQPEFQTDGTIAGLKPITDRTVKVFISSTFRDMHGERDVLTRFVFPELRSRAKQFNVEVIEVDLRWGITERESRTNQTLQICLDEVADCNMFVGMLGERYGWAPSEYMVGSEKRFDWVRDYPSGHSITELEMHFAALHDPESVYDRAFFAFRSPTFIQDIPEEYRADFQAESQENESKLSELKLRIEECGLQTFEYSASWGGVVNGKPLAGDLDTFGSQILESLWTSIVNRFTDKSDQEHAPTTADTHTHKLFAESRASSFVGRPALMKEMHRFVQSTETGILCLQGKPGIGKTSLLAAFTESYITKYSAHSMFVHFVGLTPSSTHIQSTLYRMCCELVKRFRLEIEIPLEVEQLKAVTQDVLAEAAKHSSDKFLLVLDALEGLDDVHQARTLDWLPNPLPRGVVVVASCKEGDVLTVLRERSSFTEISVSPLSMWDRGEVVRTMLAKYRKRLDESPFNNQLKELLSKRDSGIPLYLHVAVEELRVGAIFEQITPKLRAMSPVVPSLLLNVVDRLEVEHDASLVKHVLQFFACARAGLRALDVHRLIKAISEEANRGIEKRRLPTSMAISSFLHSLEPYLVKLSDDCGGASVLFHAELHNGLLKRYDLAPNSKTWLRIHRILALHFLNAADPHRDGSFSGRDRHAFAELVFHLTQAHMWPELRRVLTSLAFIRAKCTKGLGHDLLRDYAFSSLHHTASDKELQRLLAEESVVAYRSFVSRHVHIIAQKPTLTYQQALNEPDGSVLNRDVQAYLDQSNETGTMLISWENKPATIGACRLTLAGFMDAITSVCMHSSGSVMACGSNAGMLRIFDVATSKEIRTIAAHSGAINDLCFVGNHSVVSASADETARVWELSTGRLKATIKNHDRAISSLSADATGKTFATASWDCSVRVFNASNGNEVARYTKSTKPINSLSYHPDGQILLAGGWDGYLRVWDSFNKQELSSQLAHAKSIRAVAFSPTGRHYVSASLDGVVKLWSAISNQEVGSFHGHILPITKCVFSSTGHELVTVASDKKVKLWSGNLGRPLLDFGNQQASWVSCLAFAPNGSMIAAAFHSGAVKIFLPNGVLVATLTPHDSSANAVAWHSSGRTLYSVSDDKTIAMHQCDSAYNNWRLAGSVAAHDDAVTCIAASADGRYLASGSADFTVRIWQPNTLQSIAVLKEHKNTVTGVAFLPDSTVLLSVSKDRCLFVWDGKKTWFARHKHFFVHEDWINCIAVSPNGRYAITGSNDFKLKLWPTRDFRSPIEFKGHTGAVSCVGFMNDDLVYSGSFDTTCKLWLLDGSEVTTLHSHKQAVNAVTAFADVIATGSDDGHIMTTQPLVGHEIATFTGHDDRVVSVTLGPHCEIATASLDRTVKFWDKTQAVEASVHSYTITAVSVAEGCAVSVDRGGNACVWDTTEKKPRVDAFSLLHQKAINAVHIISGAADGSVRFVTASDDCSARMWAMEAGFPRMTAESKLPRPLLCLADNPSMKLIAFGGWAGLVVLCNRADLLAIKTVQHDVDVNWIASLTFANNTLFAGTLDGRATAWEFKARHIFTEVLNTQLDSHGGAWDQTWLSAAVDLSPPGQPFDLSNFALATSHGLVAKGTDFQVACHEKKITCMAVSPDGSMLITASADHSIKCWKVNAQGSEATWLTQVGEFVCQSACTSLSFHDGKILAGDSLGNVYFLA